MKPLGAAHVPRAWARGTCAAPPPPKKKESNQNCSNTSTAFRYTNTGGKDEIFSTILHLKIVEKDKKFKCLGHTLGFKHLHRPVKLQH